MKIILILAIIGFIIALLGVVVGLFWWGWIKFIEELYDLDD